MSTETPPRCEPPAEPATRGFASEPDGSIVGYMCLIDFECELGMASGGNTVHPSIADLKRAHPHVRNCGIVKVAVRAIEIVEPGRDFACEDLDLTQTPAEAESATKGILK